MINCTFYVKNSVVDTWKLWQQGTVRKVSGSAAAGTVKSCS
jgi:hypothetical protein